MRIRSALRAEARATPEKGINKQELWHMLLAESMSAFCLHKANTLGAAHRSACHTQKKESTSQELWHMLLAESMPAFC